MHTHTNFSDGSTDIERLPFLAMRAGLTHLAISDHDSIQALEWAQQHPCEQGVSIIPAAELTCFDTRRGQRVHLLCYLPNLTQELRSFCEEMARRRNEATGKSIEELEKRYPQFTRDAVLEVSKRSGITYKTHIIRVLYEYGYTDGIYKELYRELFGKGGSVLHDPAYEPLEEVLEIVHRACGVAVLAHPTVYHSMELAKELGEKGLLDGVEIEHPRNSLEDKKTLHAMAQNYGWIVTGGSDFHGMHMSKPAPLGSCVTQDSQIEALLERSCRKKICKNCESVVK